MQGDDQRRFCDRCDRHVYNLEAFSPEALVSLIERTEGRLCGLLYQRQDGTVMSDDCSVGLERARRILRQRRRKMWAGLAVGLSIAVAHLQTAKRACRPSLAQAPAKRAQRFRRVIYKPIKRAEQIAQKAKRRAELRERAGEAGILGALAPVGEKESAISSLFDDSGAWERSLEKVIDEELEGGGLGDSAQVR